MVVARLVRGLWMCGWPHRMCLVPLGGEVATKTINEFLQDDALFKELQAQAGLVPAGRSLLKRHVCNMVANKLVARCCAVCDCARSCLRNFLAICCS